MPIYAFHGAILDFELLIRRRYEIIISFVQNIFFIDICYEPLC